MKEPQRRIHAWWEERAALHPDTPLYRGAIQELREGRDPLHTIEVEEVGDVAGKRLLHLQCHIGTDTLGWVRRGATVTGIDFSAAALEQARRLSSELGLPARFLLSSVEELQGRLEGEFDIVFTSYGTICWLQDLGLWARTIAHFLADGGLFYIVDQHPMLFTIDFDAASDGETLKLRYPYFEQPEPLHFTDLSGSYADRELATEVNENHEWPHSLGEIVSALLDAGLTIESLHEHREAVWEALPCVEEVRPRCYQLPENLRNLLPMLFSLRARKHRS